MLGSQGHQRKGDHAGERSAAENPQSLVPECSQRIDKMRPVWFASSDLDIFTADIFHIAGGTYLE